MHRNLLLCFATVTILGCTQEKTLVDQRAEECVTLYESRFVDASDVEIIEARAWSKELNVKIRTPNRYGQHQTQTIKCAIWADTSQLDVPASIEIMYGR